MKKFQFIRFDVIHKRMDKRTDRQTLHDSIDRACIATRGKNDIQRFQDMQIK